MSFELGQQQGAEARAGGTRRGSPGWGQVGRRGPRLPPAFAALSWGGSAPGPQPEALPLPRLLPLETGKVALVSSCNFPSSSREVPGAGSPRPARRGAAGPRRAWPGRWPGAQPAGRAGAGQRPSGSESGRFLLRRPPAPPPAPLRPDRRCCCCRPWPPLSGGLQTPQQRCCCWAAAAAAAAPARLRLLPPAPAAAAPGSSSERAAPAAAAAAACMGSVAPAPLPRIKSAAAAAAAGEATASKP